MLTSLIQSAGYVGVMLLMALQSAAVPLPSEIILPFAGFLVASGSYTLLGMTLAASIGSVIGSLVLYYIGYYGGRPLLEKYGKYILVHKNDIDMGQKFFDKYGHSANFFGRIVPIVRTFISFPAGVSKVKIVPFITYAFAGSFIWSLLLIWLGSKLGENWTKVRDVLHSFSLVIAVLIVLAIFWYVRRHLKRVD